MGRTLDRSGSVTYQPTRCVKVDFTTSDYSESVSGEAGYYDVKEKLGVPYAFVHTETGGDLDVVFYDDDSEVLFPFQAGTDDGKVKRIYYHVDNSITTFWLRY